MVVKRYKFSNQCSDCDTVISVDSIESLKRQISKKLAKSINKEKASKANDLGLCINTGNYKDLVILSEILTELQYCNGCFSEFDYEDIQNLVKISLN